MALILLTGKSWGMPGKLEMPVPLSTSYRVTVGMPFQEGLSTSFRSVNIIISTHVDSSLFENVDGSVLNGEERSLLLESPVRFTQDDIDKAMAKNRNNLFQ